MARISRTDIYDYDTLPTFDDYLIGTDPENSLRTRNYRIADIIGLANGTATRFTTLFDTPADYIGQAGKAVIVNGTEDGLIFGDAGGGDADDTPYGSSWNSNLDAATKNAIYDKVETLVDRVSTQSIGGNKTFTGSSVFSLDTVFKNSITVGASATVETFIRAKGFVAFDNFETPTSTNFGINSLFFTSNKPTFLKHAGTTSTNRQSFDFSNTAPRTATFQNKDGVVAFLSDIPTTSLTQTSGSFTPNLKCSAGNFTYTQDMQSGKWAITGKQCTFNINLRVVSSSGSGSGGFLRVDGLNFLAGKIYNPNQVISCAFNNQTYYCTIFDGELTFREQGGGISFAVLSTSLPSNTLMYITGTILLD